MTWISSLLGWMRNRDAASASSAEVDLLERAPRVRMGALHNIAFHPKTPPIADRLDLANISSTGIGFFRGGSKQWPEKGESIQGELMIESSWHPIRIKVVHINSEIVGCEYTGADPSLAVKLKRYLESELLALKLREVNPKLLKDPEVGKARWLVGDESTCEVHLVQLDKKIYSFALNFLGHHVEGGAHVPTRFGTLTSSGEHTQPGLKISDLVRWELSAPESTVEIAIRFVDSIAVLDPQEKKEIAALIEKVRSPQSP